MTTTSAEVAITPSSRRMISATIVRCSSSGKLAHGLGTREIALIEDRLRGGDAQLLGHERDREREQRVEVEEVVGGVVAGGRQRAREDRQHQRRALADTQQDPEPSTRLAAIPAPSPQQGRERIEESDRYGASHHCLRHDIEPIATM